jgi:hypothetical protein
LALVDLRFGKTRPVAIGRGIDKNLQPFASRRRRPALINALIIAILRADIDGGRAGQVPGGKINELSFVIV